MATRSGIAGLNAYGSTGEGAGHWKLQRLTAIANVVLVIWFVASMVGMSGSSYAEYKLWLGAPLNTALMVLLVISAFWHAKLGVQVILEDYVHGKAGIVGGMVALNLLIIGFAATCIVAILKVSLGS